MSFGTVRYIIVKSDMTDKDAFLVGWQHPDTWPDWQVGQIDHTHTIIIYFFLTDGRPSAQRVDVPFQILICSLK